MKIIDAHLHYRPGNFHFDKLAIAAGHENEQNHVATTFHSLDIRQGIVMGNLGLLPADHMYPRFLSYCIGLDETSLQPASLPLSLTLVEQHLRQRRCVGIKIYAGYCLLALTDPAYIPFYELAETHNKPVAIHTGVTAAPQALLKYSHPLLLDEVAVLFPRVQFVMCHFGNPWLVDAAAVLEKNDNVAADLSGLLVGNPDIPTFTQTQAGYIEHLKTWLAYVDNYDKFLYGTDWPLANMAAYANFVCRLIPEQHYERVFFANACRIYHLEL